MSKGYEQFFKKAKESRGADKKFNLQKSPIKNHKTESQTRASAAKTSGNSEYTAEQYLRAALKLKENKNTKKASRMPATAVVILGALLLIASLGYFYPEKYESVFDKFEIGVFSSAEAAKNSETKGASEAGSAAQANVKATTTCVEQKGFTEEELSHFNKLNERKKELDLREAELNTLEEELHKQKSEVESRISKLEKVREEVAVILKDKVEIDQQRVTTLVDFYSNMKPKQAAEIFGKLNEDLAVEVLGKMKKKNAAEILNLLEPAKARAISEKFTGYKRR
jgi:flagellar motility protein MotE (MotC chaperone)